MISDDEKVLLQEACILLNLGTSNSMNPDIRAEWSDLRDRVLPGLKEITRR